MSDTENIEEKIELLKQTMWDNAGIVRTQSSLVNALEVIENLKKDFNKGFKCANMREYEFRNLLIISELIVKSAIARKESRGAHFRSDYPEKSKNAYHSFVEKGEMLSAVSFA